MRLGIAILVLALALLVPTGVSAEDVVAISEHDIIKALASAGTAIEITSPDDALCSGGFIMLSERPELQLKATPCDDVRTVELKVGDDVNEQRVLLEALEETLARGEETQAAFDGPEETALDGGTATRYRYELKTVIAAAATTWTKDAAAITGALLTLATAGLAIKSRFNLAATAAVLSLVAIAYFFAGPRDPHVDWATELTVLAAGSVLTAIGSALWTQLKDRRQLLAHRSQRAGP